MNIPITVAVRVFAQADQPCLVQSTPASSFVTLKTSNASKNEDAATSQSLPPLPTPGFIHVGGRSFPFAHALPIDCTQDQLYVQTVFPMLAMFLDGYDASFVTYGQAGTGKSHTMLGPGFNCVYGEAEQGIVLRCVRDIFSALALHRDRNYAVHIGWVEVTGDDIHDLFQNSGNVPCATVGDVFHWLQVGLANRRAVDADSSVHSIFTLTLEQQWVMPVEGLIQHRLSTASFCDLAATDRMAPENVQKQPQDALLSTDTVPRDVGLRVRTSCIRLKFFY